MEKLLRDHVLQIYFECLTSDGYRDYDTGESSNARNFEELVEESVSMLEKWIPYMRTNPSIEDVYYVNGGPPCIVPVLEAMHGDTRDNISKLTYDFVVDLIQQENLTKAAQDTGS